jgi:hypothetical protein
MRVSLAEAGASSQARRAPAAEERGEGPPSRPLAAGSAERVAEWGDGPASIPPWAKGRGRRSAGRRGWGGHVAPDVSRGRPGVEAPGCRSQCGGRSPLALLAAARIARPASNRDSRPRGRTAARLWLVDGGNTLVATHGGFGPPPPVRCRPCFGRGCRPFGHAGSGASVRIRELSGLAEPLESLVPLQIATASRGAVPRPELLVDGDNDPVPGRLRAPAPVRRRRGSAQPRRPLGPLVGGQPFARPSKPVSCGRADGSP